MIVGRPAFERAVAAYDVRGVEVPGDVTAAGRRSLAETGLFLVGEVHGVEQTPRAIFALVRALRADALAFEWSWDQFGSVVAARRVNDEALWSLPADAETFSGDGRFTAGHVRLLEALGGDLVQVVCADVSSSDTVQAREDAIARRLVEQRARGVRMVAVLGASHAAREPLDGLVPAGLRLARELPSLATCLIAPSGGTAWFHGEHAVGGQRLRFDVELPIGVARPAVVPTRDGV